MTDKEIENFVNWLQSCTAKKFYSADAEDLIFEFKNQALSQRDVISAVCKHTKGSCKIVDGKHVMTCDDCHKIIWAQDVKKCDNIWCEDGKVNVYGNEWQSCPRCRDKQTDL